MAERFIHNFAVTPEPDLKEQIKAVSECEAYKDCDIAIQADSHVGASGPIGFVCATNNKVIPATVGVDVGCTVSLYDLGVNVEDLPEGFFERFDEMVAAVVPTGFNVRQREANESKSFNYKKLNCYDALKGIERIRKSMGTLGGGKSGCLQVA